LPGTIAGFLSSIRESSQDDFQRISNTQKYLARWKNPINSFLVTLIFYLIIIFPLFKKTRNEGNMIYPTTNYLTTPEIPRPTESTTGKATSSLGKRKQREEHPSDFDWSLKLRFVKELQVDVEKIRQRYPGDLACEENIDFSGLGLRHLPPNILQQCLNAKRLDLTGNNIHWLPAELKKLNLAVLNISGNLYLQPNLEKFSWLLEIPGLKLIANDMGFDFTPRDWRGRFESNQVSTENEWMYDSTQDSDESS